jgi:DNA-binding NtrC family response regulator
MPKAVLIVEDSATQGRIVSRMFARLGLDATVTQDLNDAYEKLKSQPWSLVLIDVFLDQVNALDHIQDLRDLAKGSPIVVMSAGQKSDPVVIRTMLNKARRERADYLLPKPFSFDDVRQICVDIEDKRNAPVMPPVYLD